MRCPSCGSRLVELERSEVLIDACPECRGVWLDRGELDRLLERERGVAGGVDDPDDDFLAEMEGRKRPSTGSGKERPPAEPPRKRNRLGMLEDLFDFD
jgi:Zn-finger nucleic acid-binding protein